MAREVAVHLGTSTNGAGVKRSAAWVVTQIVLEPEAHDLMHGLGSKYLRYATQEDDELDHDRPAELPDSLTQREILRCYRDELLRYGEEVLGMWGDELSTRRHRSCTKWLMEIVLDAFPEMKGYEVT